MIAPPPPTWPEAFETVGIGFVIAAIVWAIAWWLVKRRF